MLFYVVLHHPRRKEYSRLIVPAEDSEDAYSKVLYWNPHIGDYRLVEMVRIDDADGVIQLQSQPQPTTE